MKTVDWHSYIHLIYLFCKYSVRPKVLNSTLCKYVNMSLRLELNGLEQVFREKAMKKYGYSKGALKKASIEALQTWVNEQKELPVSKEPFKLIEGILEEYRGKISSVELQHSAAKLWVK